MGVVFKINEELASIAVTSTELLATSRSVVEYLKAKDFIDSFANIILEINRSYPVVINAFQPFNQLLTIDSFEQTFDDLHKNFKDSYLLDISKPRKFCDNVYDDYIAMQQMKEAKTGFPPVKSNFIRLNELYDKWINNDAYLAMSIDSAIKLENILLSDITNEKNIDLEDAYNLCKSTFNDFTDYLHIIQKNSDGIVYLFESVNSQQRAMAG